MSRRLIVPPHGVTLKLLRAQSQLGEVETLLAAFTQEHIEGVEPEGDLDGNALTIRLPADVGHPDEIIGILIGEYIHNLRSALDQMTYALLESNLANLQTGPDQIERFRSQSQFPICDSPGHFRESYRRIAGLSDAAKRQIEGFQPYFPDKMPEGDALWCIRELSNLDKHRIANPVLGVLANAHVEVRTHPLAVRPHVVWTNGPLESGGVIGKAYFPNAPATVELRTVGGVALSLFRDVVAIGSVDHLLPRLIGDVRKVVDELTLLLE